MPPPHITNIPIRQPDGGNQKTLTIKYGGRTVAPYAFELCNEYKCTIPVQPVLNVWLRDGILTAAQHAKLVQLLTYKGTPLVATWPSAEAAYLSLIFARMVFDETNQCDVPLKRWRRFLTGQKFSNLEFLSKLHVHGDPATKAVKKTKFMVIQRLASSSNPHQQNMAGGCAVRAIVKQWPRFDEPADFAVQARIWAPIHDAKFNADTNLGLATTFKTLCEEFMIKRRRPEEQLYFVNLCKSTAFRVQTSWGLWDGVVRGPTVYASVGLEFTMAGRNFAGRLLNLCARRLHIGTDSAPMVWTPIEHKRAKPPRKPRVVAIKPPTKRRNVVNLVEEEVTPQLAATAGQAALKKSKGGERGGGGGSKPDPSPPLPHAWCSSSRERLRAVREAMKREEANAMKAQVANELPVEGVATAREVSFGELTSAVAKRIGAWRKTYTEACQTAAREGSCNISDNVCQEVDDEMLLFRKDVVGPLVSLLRFVQRPLALEAADGNDEHLKNGMSPAIMAGEVDGACQAHMYYRAMSGIFDS